MKNQKMKRTWVTPKLDQIEMIDTSVLSGGCMTGNMPGSKSMAGDENVTTNCSVGS